MTSSKNELGNRYDIQSISRDTPRTRGEQPLLLCLVYQFTNLQLVRTFANVSYSLHSYYLLLSHSSATHPTPFPQLPRLIPQTRPNIYALPSCHLHLQESPQEVLQDFLLIAVHPRELCLQKARPRASSRKAHPRESSFRRARPLFVSALRAPHAPHPYPRRAPQPIRLISPAKPPPKRPVTSPARPWTISVTCLTCLTRMETVK